LWEITIDKIADQANDGALEVAAQTVLQCTRQFALTAEIPVKFLSNQTAANLSIVKTVSKKWAQLIQADLKDEDLNGQVLRTDKCMMPSVQTAETTAKSPSSQEKDGLFSAVDVLIEMKALNQEALSAHIFPPEADPPWEEKTETKTAREQTISQTTKHNLIPSMPKWTKSWHCLLLLPLP
jgi:hypothetical protein